MAISFTAEYLFQGAKHLSFNPLRDDLTIPATPESSKYEKLYTVARGVYALGLAIVSPCGLLYHFSFAVVDILQHRNVTGLAKQHLDAALSDFSGLLHTAFQLALLATCVLAVAAAILADLPLFLVCTGAIGASVVIIAISDLELLPSLGFAKNFKLFNQYLSSEHWDGADAPTSEQSYAASYIYNQFLEKGFVVDEPLQDDLALALCQSTRRRTSQEEQEWPGEFAATFETYQLLLRHNRFHRNFEPRIEELIRRENDLKNAWQEARRQGLADFAQNAANNNQAGSVRIYDMQAFAARLEPINADLLRLPI